MSTLRSADRYSDSELLNAYFFLLSINNKVTESEYHSAVICPTDIIVILFLSFLSDFVWTY